MEVDDAKTVRRVQPRETVELDPSLRLTHRAETGPIEDRPSSGIRNTIEPANSQAVAVEGLLQRESS
jgi:hypothetical protein